MLIDGRELGSTPFSEIQVVDAGDVPVTPFSIDSAMEQISGHADDLMGGGRKVDEGFARDFKPGELMDGNFEAEKRSKMGFWSGRPYGTETGFA